jgi:RNA polymerase sigma-70 factor (ECF subfamily)
MEVSDQEAVQAALKDSQAFSVIVERYQSLLSGYVRRLGAFDSDTAKDILQETFIKVYLNLNDYDPSLRFGSWIYRIAHNETMSHFRRMKNRPHAVKSEDAMTAFGAIPDDFNLAEESDARLRSGRIAQALQQLKPEYRDLLILRFFEDKSYAEISDILQMPQGTVAIRLSRGKAALEKVLAEKHIIDLYYGTDG